MTFERLGTMNVNAEGHLEIGGVDTLKLADKYGTPLYVYDVALIRDRARGFKKTFEELGVKAQVAYASKAFSAVAIYQLMAEEGLSLDVVSGGELYTAIKANFLLKEFIFTEIIKVQKKYIWHLIMASAALLLIIIMKLVY